MSGLTKSEKKKFKENERMRIANLKGFRSESAASSFVNDTVKYIYMNILNVYLNT